MLTRLPARAGLALDRPVVAIGNFDGLHRGHGVVLARARSLAARLGRPAAVLTFEPHPLDYFAGRPRVFRLTTAAEKAMAVAFLGMDGTLVLRFDRAAAALTAEDFVQTVLIEQVGVSGVVAGEDFHFGAGRQGSAASLRQAGWRFGFAVEIVARQASDAAGGLAAISSTAVRAALSRGDVRGASHMLGRPFALSGILGPAASPVPGMPPAAGCLAMEPTCRLAPALYAVSLTGESGRHFGTALVSRELDQRRPRLDVFPLDASVRPGHGPVRIELADRVVHDGDFVDCGTMAEGLALGAARARHAAALCPVA